MPPRDLLLVLLIVLAWAGNFLTSALALREIPPFLFTALRFALLALPLLYWMKRPAPGQWPRLIAMGLCVGVLHFGLSFLALKLSGDLSSPAIVLQSYVPMTTLLAWQVLGERFGWRTGVAIALSFAGVLVLGFDPLFQFLHDSDAAEGIALALEHGLRGVYNVAGPEPTPLSLLIRLAGRRQVPVPEPLFRLLLGRFGLPRLPPGALNHIKFPVVIDPAAFRAATGFAPRYDADATAAAFRAAPRVPEPPSSR